LHRPQGTLSLSFFFSVEEKSQGVSSVVGDEVRRCFGLAQPDKVSADFVVSGGTGAAAKPPQHQGPQAIRWA